jgi:uncharacterized BrkB/YihY/UPF0761 family membrane protein
MTEKQGEKRVNVITGVVLLALAAFCIIYSLGMPLFDKYSPGPGLFPLLLGVIMALLSSSLIWEGIRAKTDKAHKFTNKKGMTQAAVLILGLGVFAFLIPLLGYLIATFLLVVFVMKLVIHNSWKTALLTALTVSAMLFLIFSVALKVNLPESPFGIF